MCGVMFPSFIECIGGFECKERKEMNCQIGGRWVGVDSPHPPLTDYCCHFSHPVSPPLILPVVFTP